MLEQHVQASHGHYNLNIAEKGQTFVKIDARVWIRIKFQSTAIKYILENAVGGAT